MNILSLHNKYKTLGGEDVVFKQENHLLQKNAHKIYTYVRDNSELDLLSSVRAGIEAVWSIESKNEVESLIKNNSIDIIHSHNTFSRLSPSIYYAASKNNIPVVQTLHNYRLICPNAMLFRDGDICELCVGHMPWSSLKYNCYRSSFSATLGAATVNGFHKLLGTWSRRVDRYIAVSEFLKRKYVQGGIPEDQIVVKPNFLSVDPGVGKGGGGYALYVGRLSKEKGIDSLLAGWRYVKRDIALKIVGDGPLKPMVEHYIKEGLPIEYREVCPRSDIFSMMKGAEALIVPSLWYEPFGLVVIEAFASGLPVITTGQGGLGELVEDGVTGLIYAPSDCFDMAEKLNDLVNNQSKREAISKNARREYENKYTAETNYKMLVSIYENVLASKVRDD